MILPFVAIALTGKRGGFAYIDRADLEIVSKYKWFHDSGGYAHCTLYRSSLRMHSLLVDRADHINSNKRDNRRSNLRVLTQAQNCQNVHTAKGAYRGVYFNESATHRPWYGQVKHKGVRYSAGFHATREEARDAVRALRASILPFATN